jgi:cytochrome b pre-mRNA-processing protein 3
VQEELFDIFWHDTKARIRAEGVNELTVNKHLKDVQQVTFQHLTHYDHAYSEYELMPAKRFEELAGLVWMHVLLKDEEDVTDDQLKRLAFYVDAQYNNIMHELPKPYFEEGRIAWVDIPDFTGLRDAKGSIVPERPIHPDDALPKDWFMALTDAGTKYYYNPVTKETRWDRPTFAS